MFKILIASVVSLLVSTEAVAESNNQKIDRIEDHSGTGCLYNEDNQVIGIDPTSHVNAGSNRYESYGLIPYPDCQDIKTQFSKVNLDVNGIIKPLYTSKFNTNVCLTIVGEVEMVFGLFSCELVKAFAIKDAQRILESNPAVGNQSTSSTSAEVEVILEIGNIKDRTIRPDSRLHVKLIATGDISRIKNAWFIIKDPDNGIDQVHKFSNLNTVEYVDVTANFVHYKNVVIEGLVEWQSGKKFTVPFRHQIQYSKFPSDYTEGSAELPSPTNPGTWVGLTLQVADALSDEPRRCFGYDSSLLGVDISENNRLVSCIGTVIPFAGLGRVVKLANQGDELFYVVNKLPKGGNTILELAPLGSKALPYTDDVIFVANGNKYLTKSWFANYKLPHGHHEVGGYSHILHRHSPSSAATRYKPNEAKKIARFSSEAEIKALIERALTDKLATAQISNSRDNIKVVVDFSRQIGFQYLNPDTRNIQPLNKLTIILESNGNVVTAYPSK